MSERTGTGLNTDGIRRELDDACYENVEQEQPLTEERRDWLIDTCDQLSREVDRLRKRLGTE